MALRLDTIKFAHQVLNFRIRERLDPQISLRNYKRRQKGKLYLIDPTDFTRNWMKDVASMSILGTFGLRQNPITSRWDESVLVPEGELVMYLKTAKSFQAKVLWGEQIYLVPRADLSLEPISS